jgi:ubiquinone/menaquinone biosynthesis C-methylase UbiE
MKEQKIIEIYRDLAKEYEKKVTGFGKYIAYKKMAILLLNYLSSKKAIILDLGCGTGLSSLYLFKKNFNIIGVDISKEMLAEAEKKPYTKLINQNIEKPLNFKNSSFDAVLLIGVMELIEDPSILFFEINRILKNNGYFSITIPKKIKNNKIDYKSYNKKDIEPLFLKSKFEVIKCEEFFGYRKKINDDTLEYDYYGYILKKF